MSKPVDGSSGSSWLGGLFGGSGPKLTKAQRTALKALEAEKSQLEKAARPLLNQISRLQETLDPSKPVPTDKAEALNSLQGQLISIRTRIESVEKKIRTTSIPILPSKPMEMTSMSEAAAAAASSTDIDEARGAVERIPPEIIFACNEVGNKTLFSKDKLVSYYTLTQFLRASKGHPFETAINRALASVPRDHLQRAIRNAMTDFTFFENEEAKLGGVNETQYVAAKLALTTIDKSQLDTQNVFGIHSPRDMANEIIRCYEAKVRK